MKKNVMMRVASIMLVLVLMSSSVISGTFAKYVTQDQGFDSARVAKFGVVIEADSFGMFEADYKTDDTSATFTGDYSVSAAADDRDDLLAPGTKGSFADIAITGTPEVAVDVAIAATVEVSNNWVDGNGTYYCPVVVTVGDEAICGLKYSSASDFADAIALALEGKSEQYAPNTDLATIYNNTNLDLAWEWAFEDADHVALACDCAAGAQNDVQDTDLGDLAVTEDLYISIGVAITVTQID